MLPRDLNPVERALLVLAPAVFVASEIVSRFVAGSVPPHRALSPFYNNPFLALAAALIALCLARRSDWIAVLALGAALEAARLALATVMHVPLAASLPSTGLGIWVAAMILQGRRAFAATGRERLAAIDLLLTQFALPAGIALTFFGNSIVRVLVAGTVDPSLYAIDGMLPVPFARWAVDLAEGQPGVRPALATVYGALFATFAAIVALGRRAGEHPGKFVGSVLLVGLVGFLLYFIAPGVGPGVAIHDRYGAALPDPATIDLAPFAAPFMAPRNAMPSLHTTYALVMLIAAARFGAGWFAAAVVFLLLTVLATLGLREHYVIDLVVAVPLSLAITWFLSAFDREAATPRSLVRAAVAFAIVLAWLLAVRFGTAALREVPWLASMFVAATLAAAAAIGIPRSPPARARSMMGP